MFHKITAKKITAYQNHLVNAEKSAATAEKYLRDLRLFLHYLDSPKVDKDAVLAYKAHLTAHYAPASVNSMLSSLNSFFVFQGWCELKLKGLKLQKQIFAGKNKMLSKKEYLRLLDAARQKKNKRLFLLLQTICSTGIRISELCNITAEAARREYAQVQSKGKIRTVFLPRQLCRSLKQYMRENHIKSGSIFVTRSGTPLDRSNIWSEMKKLCAAAGVSEEKVFPHNLRHLFAVTHYAAHKDMTRLADLLGHSSINTTRIYIMETGETHRRQIQSLGLLRC